MTRPSKSHKGF